jgi:hypothetical protein
MCLLIVRTVLTVLPPLPPDSERRGVRWLNITTALAEQLISNGIVDVAQIAALRDRDLVVCAGLEVADLMLLRRAVHGFRLAPAESD